jgi:hypothetical protein
MNNNLSRSIASYKRTPKICKNDKLTGKKRTSNLLGLLGTPSGVKYKVRKESKSKRKTDNLTSKVRIWKVTDVIGLCPPSSYQYMNPASWGPGVNAADSLMSVKSSENWYKRNTKFSRSSNCSSARGASAQLDAPDDGFLNGLLHKNDEYTCPSRTMKYRNEAKTCSKI